MNRNKRNGHKLLIHVQGEDSKVGELIHPLQRVVLMKFIQNDQISIREIREIHKIVQNNENKHRLAVLTDWTILVKLVNP